MTIVKKETVEFAPEEAARIEKVENYFRTITEKCEDPEMGYLAHVVLSAIQCFTEKYMN